MVFCCLKHCSSWKVCELHSRRSWTIFSVGDVDTSMERYFFCDSLVVPYFVKRFFTHVWSFLMKQLQDCAAQKVSLQLLLYICNLNQLNARWTSENPASCVGSFIMLVAGGLHTGWIKWCFCQISVYMYTQSIHLYSHVSRSKCIDFDFNYQTSRSQDDFPFLCDWMMPLFVWFNSWTF